MTRTSHANSKRWRLVVAASSFALVAATLAIVGPVAEAEDEPEGEVASAGAVSALSEQVADYETRAPGDYTAESWEPFAEALNTAADISGEEAPSEAELVEAKTGLQTAASELEPLQGSFETITNDTFWNDTDGNPIYSQGGGVFKFGDTYYWYGVHYRGAESYRENPTQKYDNEVSFVSIPVYSSQDLVNWTFENDVATTSTAIGDMGDMGNLGWVGRLGVSYNENTGKYVLLTQAWHPSQDHSVLFLQGDSPTGDFTYGNHQTQIENSPTTGTGDQTVFTDEDGQDYLIMSNREGRSRSFVAKISEEDSLSVEPAVEIGRHGDGREGNAMFKLDGTYYMCASDLHGWNTSVNYCIDGGEIQGSYSDWYTMPGTEMDYSHVTQTGFFVTVQGTEQTTVLYAGDRWADFAWNGIGYNQWVPITDEGDGPQFHSLSQWEFNAATGEWRVGPENNYILNPDFQADRVEVSELRGWTNTGGSVSNVEPGANGSRFALRVSGGGTQQEIEVPEGSYRLALLASGDGQVVVTDAGGNENVLEVSSGDWSEHELTGIDLAAGAVTVSVESSGTLTVDQLSLVQEGA